jgi:DNA primase
VKAVNFLLPHLQRVPSRIVRDELAADMAQKLGIDSAVLRQELRHAVSKRTGTVNATGASQVTESERLLIRALAPGGDHDEQLRHRARSVLRQERLHEGLSAESLLEVLLANDAVDPASLSLADGDRALLAATLMREDEQLTPELLERSLDALRRRALERRQRALKAQIAEAERRQDMGTLSALLRDKVAVDRALAAIH